MRVDVAEARCGARDSASACARAGSPWRHGTAVIRFGMRPKSAIAYLVLACALGIGCGSGPELQFADAEDASAADASGDGGADDGGAVDAAVADTATPAADAGVADVSSGLACPASPPPPGVNACCGATPCIDRGGNNACAQCAACTQLGCKATEVCCYAMSNGNLGCKKSAADCK
jgi:hypothetical protein